MLGKRTVSEFAALANDPEFPAPFVATTTTLVAMFAVLMVRVAVVAVVAVLVRTMAAGTVAGWNEKVAPDRLRPVRLTVSPVPPARTNLGLIPLSSGMFRTVK